MRSSRIVASLLFLALAVQACGLLGSRDRSRQPIVYSARGHGCLNGLKTKVTAYFEGTIAEDEWSQIWDCTSNSLQTLDDLIARGPGLAVGDVHTLLSKVLITEKPVPERFTRAVLSLKAAIIGGSPELVSREELTTVRNLVRVIQRESLGLLPVLRGTFAPRQGLALAEQVHSRLATVNAALPGSTRKPISRATLDVLIQEGQKILDLQFSLDLVELLISAKLVIAGGADQEIEARAWDDVLENLSRLSGAALAYWKSDPELARLPNETWEFYYALAQIATEAMKHSITLHGGAIPLREIDRLIDAGPEKLGAFSHATLKKVFDSLTRRLLPTTQPRELDSPWVDRVMAKFEEWKRRQSALEWIFGSTPLDPAGVSTADFVTAAQAYAENAGGFATEVARLIQIANEVKPLYSGSSGEILLGGESKQSLKGLGILQAIDLLAAQIFKSYSSLPGKDQLKVADVQEFVEDFKQLSIDRGTLDPTVAFYAERRFREADSYAPVSNGDGLVDLTEVTYYSAYVYSIEALAIRIRALTEERCKIDDNLDSMKWHRMDANCFRKAYFGNIDTLWKRLPRLQAFYRSLDDGHRQELEHTIEHGARLKGYSDEPIGGYDAQSFAAVIHFEEAYFDRYDVNRDSVIQTDEALEAAKAHRRVIAEIGHLDVSQSRVLDAIYTYGVKHGHAPNREGLGTVEFVSWLGTRPFWNIKATKTDIFKVIPLINIYE